jgi:hypothetical protein
MNEGSWSYNVVEKLILHKMKSTGEHAIRIHQDVFKRTVSALRVNIS